MYSWIQHRDYINKIGYVADFCKICRKTSRFQLLQLNHQLLYSHLPVFGTSITGYFKCCMVCQTKYEAEQAIYPVIHKKLEPIEAMLKSLPKPTPESIYRMSVESQIANSPGSIHHDLRMKLLREPFFILSPEASSQLKIFSLDIHGFYLFIFSIVLIFLFLSQIVNLNQIDDPLIQFAFSIAVGLFILLFYKIFQRNRFIMKFLIRNLATSLRPLKPSEEELEIVVSQMKDRNLKIGRLFNHEKLVRLSQEIYQDYFESDN